jgi:hypothetical protein
MKPNKTWSDLTWLGVLNIQVHPEWFTRQIRISILVAIFTLGSPLICMAESDCSIIGFWRVTENDSFGYQDINDTQILVVNGRSSDCQITQFANYHFDNDTVYIQREEQPELPIKLLASFVNCDSLHLINLDGSNQPTNSVLYMGRRDQHECDYSATKVVKKPFFERKAVIDIAAVIWLIIYLVLLIYWLILYRRKQNRNKIWILLMITCLLFTFTGPLCYALFVVHAAISVIHWLRQLQYINVLGKVAFYGVFVGIVVMIEYYMRFGSNSLYIYSYSTIIPVLANLLGIRLIADLYNAGTNFVDQRTSLIASAIALLGPQFLLYAYEKQIFHFFDIIWIF